METPKESPAACGASPGPGCSPRKIKMSELSEHDLERIRRFGRDWVKDFSDSKCEHMLLAARLYFWESLVVPE